MNVLIVYGSQFGTTAQLARSMGEALSPEHRVTVLSDASAAPLPAADTEFVFVGAPTQWGGKRILVRKFLNGLREHGFGGLPAAAFDTRSPGDERKTGAAAQAIAELLRSAGCTLVVPPEGFVVSGYKGLAPGEEERAREWAVNATRSVIGGASREIATPIGV